MRTKISW